MFWVVIGTFFINVVMNRSSLKSYPEVSLAERKTHIAMQTSDSNLMGVFVAIPRMGRIAPRLEGEKELSKFFRMRGLWRRSSILEMSHVRPEWCESTDFALSVLSASVGATLTNERVLWQGRGRQTTRP